MQKILCATLACILEKYNWCVSGPGKNNGAFWDAVQMRSFKTLRIDDHHGALHVDTSLDDLNPFSRLREDLNQDIEKHTFWFWLHCLLLFFFSDVSSQTKPCNHAYVNVLTRGDLSSLHWVESPLKYFSSTSAARDNMELCTVYYTALNFRDVMLATGKLPPDAIPGDLAAQDCILGMEFSGRDAEGNRVMGLLPAKVRECLMI